MGWDCMCAAVNGEATPTCPVCNVPLSKKPTEYYGFYLAYDESVKASSRTEMDSEMLPGGLGGIVGQHRNSPPARAQPCLPSDGQLPTGWKRKEDKKKGTARYLNPGTGKWQADV